MATQLPPAFSINETKAEVRLLEDNNDEPVYIITSRSGEKIKKKVYVKIESGLPEVTHEETTIRVTHLLQTQKDIGYA